MRFSSPETNLALSRLSENPRRKCCFRIPNHLHYRYLNSIGGSKSVELLLIRLETIQFLVYLTPIRWLPVEPKHVTELYNHLIHLVTTENKWAESDLNYQQYTT
jgi:hypothetical protein